MEQFSGTINNILFSNEENGWTVAKVKVPRLRELTTIVGTLPGIQPGETIHCDGEWKHHQSFGTQFVVSTYQLTAPSDVKGIQKYLESGLIKGIGPHFAEKIVSHFGPRTLKVIDENPDLLLSIEGIGEKRVELIRECWQSQRSIREVMIFLQSHNVSPSLAQKIYKQFGSGSIQKIQENPYELARTLFGVGFKTADALAKNLGIPHDSPARIQAGIIHFLWEKSQDGHVCYPEPLLAEEVGKMLEVDQPLVTGELSKLEALGRLVKQEHDLYVKPLFLAELGIAKELKRLLLSPCSIRPIQLAKGIEWVAEKMNLKFAIEQETAITSCLTDKVHIITGGPGTGKSTITRAILQITEKVTGGIVLAAPTGRAAKRLSEITKQKASTIHSLLEMDFKEGGFKRGKDNPLEGNLFIIDEASMIDTQLMYSLLKAIPSHSRVIFVGDVDQLPSVGPGCVLKDLIESERIPVTLLNVIFRQAQGSKIIRNAHLINKGFFPDLTYEEGDDFLFLESDSQEDIAQKIIQLIKERVPKKFNLDPVNEIQVLSPMKRGIVGSENLNQVLQETLNPSDHPLIKMGRRFHLHDKVMQIRNDYQKGVYNGDIGRISSIDLDNQELAVNFDGIMVPYDFSELDELVLAYATSIHKYQGSECPCIIMPVHLSHFKLLFRNLLYTGLTRGRKLVILLGTKKALAIALNTNEAQERHTGLKKLIIDNL
ncbi:MAG: ATP-dependent RecD-like DNA helicase [Simkaniaceae bacterium]|nr:ATP-dependent RecD-like DNA helicase [Simkaniaceae bacterium]